MTRQAQPVSRRIREFRICKYCGNQYKARREQQKFCGSKCYTESRIGRKQCRVDIWTEEEIATLKKLYGQRLPLVEIAQVIGRTRQAVNAKCTTLGLDRGHYRKKWTIDDRQLVEKKLAQGFAVKDIASMLKVTTKALQYQIGKWGLATPPGTQGFSEKASRRNKKLWSDPDHVFNQPEYREKLSANWQDPKSKFNSPEYRQLLSDNAMRVKLIRNYHNEKSTHYRGGYRPDLGFYVRSRWEANIARYLKWLVSRGQIRGFEYEPKTFEFFSIKRGNRTYTPDFRVYNNNGTIEYWEVKGHMDNDSRVKLKRMAKYYPDIKIHLIDKAQYNEIKKWSRLIIGWDDSDLGEIAATKKQIADYLDNDGWYVLVDTPYSLDDEGPFVGVIHIQAIKEARTIFVEVVPPRFLDAHVKSKLQLEILAHGGEYLIAWSVEGVERYLKLTEV